MYKKHSTMGDDRYFIIPPTEFFKHTQSHNDEALLLGMSLTDYYKEILKFPSATLKKYTNFISYSLNEKEAHTHMLRLNRAYKKLK